MKKFQQIIDAIRLGLQLSQIVEVAIPGAGKGKQKLSFVLGAIGDVMGSIDAITPIVAKVVSRYVTAANESGGIPAPVVVEVVEVPDPPIVAPAV